MSVQEFFSELQRIYPPNRLLTGNAELAPYESDGLTSFRAKPSGVVLPEPQDEIIQTVQICSEPVEPNSEVRRETTNRGC